MLFSQRLDKIIFRRKYRRRSHQNHHNLSCGKASFHQHMAEQSVACVLVEGSDLKGSEHGTDGSDDLVGLLVLNQTGFNGNQVVGSLFINAGNGVAPAVMAKYGMDLISVMVRLLHSDHLFNRTASSQKRFQHLPLLSQLFLIGKMEVLAGAALFINRARFSCFSSLPCFSFFSPWLLPVLPFLLYQFLPFSGCLCSFASVCHLCSLPSFV